MTDMRTANIAGGHDDNEAALALNTLFEQILDILETERGNHGGEIGRLYAIAYTQTQTAQMWSLKSQDRKNQTERSRKCT
jgi:hypothetical protein